MITSPRRLPVLLASLLFSVLLAGCGVMPLPHQDVPEAVGGPPGLERARTLLGPPRSNGDWLSGVWPGGNNITGERADAFGSWRGTATDVGVTFPATNTWQQIHDSTWHIDTYAGFGGALAYGLPMLPSDDSGSLRTIARGEHDWVYRKVARDLQERGRGRSIVRIGWEANGDWFPWNTRAAQAADYVAAYRHIVGVLRSEAPELVIDFDVACGTPLRGQSDRTDTLTKLYPGDDVVDVVGCDTYDWYHTTSKDAGGWELTQRPKDAVGIADVADFARAHGKGLTIPEWGLASEDEGGAADNPYFIERMREYFDSNADILVMENYFNEPATSLANSVWDPVLMPRASETYRRLW
jgi:hypothetical protein